MIIASLLTLISVTGALLALQMANQSTAVAAQHFTAMCLCHESLEQMRTATFADLTTAKFPGETGLVMTHTESKGNFTVLSNRAITITAESSAGVDAKRVVITVSWTFRGRAQQERLEAVLYDLS